MPPLRRHQLLCLNALGWAAVAGQVEAGLPDTVLQLWRSRRLPLVLCRQPQAGPHAPLCAGLPLPARWARRRCAVQVPREGIAYFAEFPTMLQVLPEVPVAHRASLVRLSQQLAMAGLRAQVYGSFGWQALTGMAYVREGSDLDLWVGVAHAAEADLAARCLQQCDAAGEAGLRLDGELVFPHGDAVSWREWLRFRAGCSRSLLVKALHGARLCHEVPQPEPELCCA
jgi:phosphoribosyl-dephospho-CoA transferase